MILLIILALITGILVKVVDNIEDDHLPHRTFLYPAAIGYGLLIGIVISFFDEVAPLWIGIIIGMAAAQKVDTLSHFIGIATATGTAFVLGLPKVNYLLGIIFAVAAFTDEKIDMKLHKMKKFDPLKKILESRLVVELTALVVSILTGMWMVFVAILFFDIGYIATQYLFKNKKKLW